MHLDDELRAIFLEEVQGYVVLLSDSDGDLHEQSRTAHAMKGAAGMLGLTELQGMARELEDTLEQGEAGPRDRHLPRIKAIVDMLEAGLQPDEIAATAVGQPPGDGAAEDPPDDEPAGDAAPDSGSASPAADPTPETETETEEGDRAPDFDDETAGLLRGFFVEEARDHLEAMEGALDDLRQRADDPEALTVLFRAAHTLKGAAATVGLGTIAGAANALEDRLEAIRDRGEVLTLGLLDAIVQGSDLLAAMLETELTPEQLEPLAELLEKALLDAAPAQSARGSGADDAVPAETSDRTEEGSGSSALGEFDEETAALLRSFFAEEARDHLSSMEQELEALRHDATERSAVDGFFRAAHTLKGAAATVDVTAVSEIAHRLEDLLEAQRDAGDAVGDALLELLQAATDGLSEMLDTDMSAEALAPLAAAILDTLPAVRGGNQHLGAAGTTSDTPSPATDADSATGGSTNGFDAETAALLVSFFAEEAQDHHQAMERALDQLRRGEGEPSAAIDSLFRSAHTIKGAAATVGVTAVSDVAHRLEDRLDLVRKGRATLDDELSDLLIQCTDYISAMLDTDLSPDALAPIRAAAMALLTGEEAPPPAKDADASVGGPRPTHPAPRELPPLVAEYPPRPAPEAERQADPERRQTERRGDDTRMMRVSAPRMDELLDAVGELVYRRTLLERRSRELGELVRDLGRSHQSLRAAIVELRGLHGTERMAGRFGELEVEFSDVLANFDRANLGLQEETEGLRKDAIFLQEGLTEVRMLSVRYLFARLRRAVRDIARSEGKQVEFTTEGEETEIDKAVAEKVADPMIHLIRNAVAHGVEPPDEREKAGKPRLGHITLRATTAGNTVTLEVSDDGRGIDVDAIREKLIAEGVMGAEEAAATSEDELQSAIFLPGLSTRKTADEVAGRGVGLDAVQSAMTRLGGEVAVHSVRNEGTRFLVRLPLSTAVTNALLFKNAGETCCIPLQWVEKTQYIKPEDIVRHRGRNAVVYKDTPIPFIHLSTVLKTEKRVAANWIPAVILRHRDLHFALAVDKIVGPREIVLRKLGGLLDPMRIYEAATISGAGKVQLVLNVGALAQWTTTWRIATNTGKYQRVTRKRRILVCDDSRSIREVVSRILTSEGYEVELAHDGWDAWERMSGLRVDLLLTDLEMPRMDGYALVEKVRKDSAYDELPILVLSSRTGEENQRRALAAGANHFLFKPVNRRVILSRIAEELDR